MTIFDTELQYTFSKPRLGALFAMATAVATNNFIPFAYGTDGELPPKSRAIFQPMRKDGAANDQETFTSCGDTIIQRAGNGPAITIQLPNPDPSEPVRIMRDIHPSGAHRSSHRMGPMPEPGYEPVAFKANIDGREVKVHALVIRADVPRDNKTVPPMYFFLAGQGLTAETMLDFSMLDFADLVFVYPPGSVLNGHIFHDPKPTDMTDFADGYSATIEALIQFAASSSLRRSPQQRLVLVGHSYGGLQAADIAYRSTVVDFKKYKQPRLSVAGIILIASPLTDSAYKAIEKTRNEAGIELWDRIFKQYCEHLSNRNFIGLARSHKDLVRSYATAQSGNLLHNGVQTAFDLIIGPHAPHAMLLLRKFPNGDDEVLRQLAELYIRFNITTYGFLGMQDALMNYTQASKDYELARVFEIPFPEGGHFLFKSEIHTIVDLIYSFKSIAPVAF